MKNSINTKGLLLVITMIFIAAFSRMIPHLPNFTAVGAMALFGSAYFTRKYLAIIAPLAAMWISDLVINNTIYAKFNEGFVWFQSFQMYTFLAITLITLLGIVLFKKVSVAKVFAGSTVSAIIFFIVANFGAWVSPYSLFPKTATGLFETYVAGIPFLGNNLMGTLFYAGILFGSYYVITKKFPSLSLRNNNTAFLA